MATSSDLLHTNESNNGSDESISNCANSSNLAESQADEESIQTTNADSEAATSPGVHENEDVDSKADFGATPWYDTSTHTHTHTFVYTLKNVKQNIFTCIYFVVQAIYHPQLFIFHPPASYTLSF